MGASGAKSKPHGPVSEGDAHSELDFVLNSASGCRENRNFVTLGETGVACSSRARTKDGHAAKQRSILEKVS